MSKKHIVLLTLLLAVPVALIVVARSLRWYALYTVPTIGMDPAYKAGARVFASSLVSPRRGHAVAYEAAPLPFESPEPFTALSRIVAVENDTLEIRRGLLYVNGRPADDTTRLCYFFRPDSAVVFEAESYDQAHRIFDAAGETVLNFSYADLRRYGILDRCKRIYDENRNISPVLFGSASEGLWTTDDFGPVIVPPGKVFVMGDNRSNSADSRSRGFVDREKIVAVALN